MNKEYLDCQGCEPDGLELVQPWCWNRPPTHWAFPLIAPQLRYCLTLHESISCLLVSY